MNKITEKTIDSVIIRCWKSYYTIPKIQALDSANRNIRFHESYYTISRIVLYDFQYRYQGYHPSACFAPKRVSVCWWNRLLEHSVTAHCSSVSRQVSHLRVVARFCNNKSTCCDKPLTNCTIRCLAVAFHQRFKAFFPALGVTLVTLVTLIY